MSQLCDLFCSLCAEEVNEKPVCQLNICFILFPYSSAIKKLSQQPSFYFKVLIAKVKMFVCLFILILKYLKALQ